jgi:hypothetical protein
MKYFENNLNNFYFTGSEKVSGFTGELLTYDIEFKDVQTNSSYTYSSIDYSSNPFRYNLCPFYLNSSGSTGYTNLDITNSGQYEYTIRYSGTTVEIGRCYFDIFKNQINYINTIKINEKIIN